jgi:Ala-tRNA(Pro) deacylase
MVITEFLMEQRVEFEPVPHPPAYTANQRAKYLRVSGSYVAKAVLLYGSEGFLLATLPATHRIDVNTLGEALGGPVRLATEQEIGWIFRDCEWGVVPPFGTLYGLHTLLEDSIAPDAIMIFETQTHVEAVRLKCSDYERLEHPRRLHFADHIVPQGELDVVR